MIQILKIKFYDINMINFISSYFSLFFEIFPIYILLVNQ